MPSTVINEALEINSMDKTCEDDGSDRDRQEKERQRAPHWRHTYFIQIYIMYFHYTEIYNQFRWEVYVCIQKRSCHLEYGIDVGSCCCCFLLSECIRLNKMSFKPMFSLSPLFAASVKPKVIIFFLQFLKFSTDLDVIEVKIRRNHMIKLTICMMSNHLKLPCIHM